MLLDRINDAGSSEELFRALTANSPVGVFASSASGACVYVNDMWCELAGLSFDEALGDGWQRALHPEDAERVLGEWTDAMEHERDSIVEYRFLRPDGGVASIRGFTAVLLDGEGRVAGWTGTCLDLTAAAKRERQQEAIAEFGLRTLNRTDPEALVQDAVETVATGLDAEYSILLEVQPDGATVFFRAGHGWNLSATEVVARLVGDSPAAQAVRASGPVLIDHDPETVPDRREDLLKAHDVASSAAMVVHGPSRPWGVLAVHSRRRNAFTENDLFFVRAIASVLAAALDRQRSEESARQLAGIVESTLDAIFSRTTDGIVTSWNAAATRTYGYSAGEMIGRSVEILVPPDRQGEPQTINERLLRGETVEQFETVRVRKDGTLIDVDVTVSPVRDATGRMVGVSAITRDVSERKRVEAAVRKSEALATAITDSALDGIITIDHTGAIVEFNPSAETIFGRRRHDVLGRKMSEVVIPRSQREAHERGLARLLETGEGRVLGKRIELTALHADGREFPVELTINAVAVDGPPLFTGFLRDISERRRAEQEQRELAAIVGASDDAILGTTPGGVITTWNSAAERMYGYSADEVVGRPVDFLVPVEKGGELTGIFERMHRGEPIRHFESVRRRKDGTHVDVALTISPITDATGEITGVSEIARDMTERKLGEAKLRESEARYRELFENATDLIATVDTESCFTDVNRAFAETLGYERDELIGRPLSEVVPPESRELLENAREGKLAHEVNSTIYEHELVAKDGCRIEVEVSSRLITHDGEPVGVEAICRDISERKRLESQLRHAQKMEAIGNLAGGVAHDFNNLLTVINGNADRALGLDDVGAIKTSLGAVLNAGQSAAALTRQLLAFSRQQVLQPRVLDLAIVLANVEQLLDSLLGETVHVERTIEHALGHVRVDPSQIEQVLMNLAVNARDAMPDGGSIRIAAGNVDVDAAYASTRAELEPGQYVELTVSDTGIGMDEDTRGHVFEPFFTTKDDGTGLGLSTVYGIVKQSGGNISVYSEPGSGTTFRILLPRVDALPEAQQPATRAMTGELAGTETILIIEDNELVRELTGQILAGLGYTIHTAATADEVIALGTSLRGPLHLVVSDVMLPGLPGPELVKLLHQSHPETKCLYTSGYAPSLASLRGGFESDQPFLAKPFTTIELASLVRKVLDG